MVNNSTDFKLSRADWRCPAISFVAFIFATTAAIGQTRFVTIHAGDVEDVSRRLSEVTAVRGVFIGISRYAEPTRSELNNAAGDAKALADAFVRRCGLLDPKVLTDQSATLLTLRAALEAIGKNCASDDLFIFHFSGHGLGLKQEGKRVFKGLLMLHEAPTLSDLWRGKFTNGVINLDLLDAEIDRARIRAKHRLIILDSCYGGLGAYPRQIIQASPPLPGAELDRFRLRHSVTYVISAGGAEQEVLDGPPGGRGLLTGALVAALTTETGQPLATVDGRSYLPMRNCFDRIARDVNESASAIARAHNAKVPMVNRSIESVANRIQVPLDQVRGGEGHIYLPWRELGTAPPPATDAASHPSAVALVRGPAEMTSDLEAWYANTALTRGSPGHTSVFHRFSRLLLEGPPTATTGQLNVAVETLGRVRADVLRTLLHKPKVGSDDDVAAADESLRQQTRGAEWTRLSDRGGVLTTADELGLRFYNLSTNALYCYVLGLDGRGNVQFLSDHAPTAARLNGRTGRTLPPSRVIFRGRPDELLISRGWRIDPTEKGVENALLVIASTQPWPELVDVVTRLAALTNNAAQATDGLLAALPHRIGAITEPVLHAEPDNESGWPRGTMPVAFTASGSWLGVSYGWRIAPGEARLGQAESNPAPPHK